jgi:hypothetical protein
MENLTRNNPKDEQITNDDNAVTNQPPDPLKGEEAEEADNADDTAEKADDDELEEENSSNKDAGPAGENL